MKYRTFENGGTVEGRVSINGLIMTGPLKLQKDPVELNEAANKSYVDNTGENIDASKIVSGLIAVERMPSLSGDFNSVAGTGVITLKNSGVVPGSYTKVTVNSGGLVTNGNSLIEADIPGFGWERITSGKPVTLDGYGITNGVNAVNGTVNGNIVLVNDPVDTTDLATKRYVDNVLSSRVGFSTGDIVSNEGPIVPTGFLRCNGAEISKTTYSALYAVIGDQFGGDLVIGSGQPWKQQYGFNDIQSTDITGWTTGTSLPVGLNDSQAIVTKNRVYLLGGTNSGYTSTVYTAPINEDGTLGTWTTSGTSLPGPLAQSLVIVTKNRVYLLGGVTLLPPNGTATVSTVYTAPIKEDGTLGTWTTGTDLPGVLTGSQAIVTKNRVYLLGGNGISGYKTYTAPINADGTLGAWTTGTDLPGVLAWSQAIVTKNRVYLLGGRNVSTVYTAPINADGTLEAWTTGTSLPGTLAYSQAIVTKNRVYLLGGDSGSGVEVYTAPINADGTLGTWTTGTSLPGTLSNSQAIVTKNRVYLLGGSSGSVLSTVYTASFSGGLNDYSLYYDGSILPVTDPDNFRIPDYTELNTNTIHYFIKY